MGEVIIPVLAILTAVIGFQLLAQGLRAGRMRRAAR